MGVVISFVNAKGGVAKTSLALTLADEFSRIGKKILLVDFDPQATITQFFGIRDGEHPDYKQHSIARLYEEEVLVDGLSIPLSKKPISLNIKSNFDIVLSTKKLQSIAESSMPAKEYILKDFIESIKNKYDIIIVDPPGVLGFFLSSIILSTDLIFIPQRVNFHDNTGTRSFLEAVLREAKIRRITVNIGGFIPVFFEKTREESILSQMKDLQEYYIKYTKFGIIRHIGNSVWLPKIRRLVAWEQSASEDMLLRDYVEKKDRSKLRVLDDVIALRDAVNKCIDSFEKQNLEVLTK